jgi:hypothetical protein
MWQKSRPVAFNLASDIIEAGDMVVYCAGFPEVFRDWYPGFRQPPQGVAP